MFKKEKLNLVPVFRTHIRTYFFWIRFWLILRNCFTPQWFLHIQWNSIRHTKWDVLHSWCSGVHHDNVTASTWKFLYSSTRVHHRWTMRFSLCIRFIAYKTRCKHVMCLNYSTDPSSSTIQSKYLLVMQASGMTHAIELIRLLLPIRVLISHMSIEKCAGAGSLSRNFFFP